MTPFVVYRWNDKVYINEKFEYRCSEILCDYLNLDIKKLEEKRNLLQAYQYKILYPYGKSRDIPYSQYVHDIQKIFVYLDQLILSLKPFGKLQPYTFLALFDLLNEYDYLFINEREEDLLDEENGESELTEFIPAFYDEEFEMKADELNEKIKKMFSSYLLFCDDVLRVHYVFSDFLDNYFHTRSTFPNRFQTAEAYRDYMDAHDDTAMLPKYKTFVPIKRPVNAYDILTSEDEKGISRPLLCEVTEFDDVGSFLATELFTGMQSGQLPKRCSCCKKYFLPENGYYPDFCERVAPGEKEKTCRDVGARKKYDDKVKSDPIWKPYQRAYKTHYARYMKKKMTVSQFEQWSRLAIELRDAMLAQEHLPDDGEKMILAEYEARLKE